MKKTSKQIISVILSVLMLLAYLPTMAFAETSGYYEYSLYEDGNAEITGVSADIVGDVTIPGTIDGYPVTSIGDYAFQDCTSLTSITIPYSVNSIGENAFSYFDNLSDVYYGGTEEQWNNIVIGDNNEPLISATIHFSDSQNNEQYYTYSLDSSGNAAIIDVNTDISGDVTIPSTLDGHPVTSIRARAFDGCYSLTSITIPDSVSSIENYAFLECVSLTSIIIPDSITSIGYFAFDDCISLTSIDVDKNNSNYSSQDGILFNKTKTEIIKYRKGKLKTSYVIPDCVTSIGDWAFDGCSSLTSITIPDSVTSIGDSAFYGCTSLTSITIPDSVTEIGESAFYDCTSLTSITIPDSVTSIGLSAFAYCTSLTSIDVDKNNSNYSSQDGILFNKAKTEIIKYPNGKSETSYVIPDSVTSIGDSAFYYCESLTSITIPGSVTSIGDDAFNCCTSLTSITIPDSVTSIGDMAFNNCILLTSISIPDSVTSIGDMAFGYCSSLTNITIPDSVTSIGDSAFYYCESLTSITIPDSVTSIGDMAFNNCILLTSISIPDSVTSIGDMAFGYCSSLTNITIPDSVTSIGESAFYDCTSLTSITIPDSVTSIGESAFYDCESLTSIIIPNGVTSIGECLFFKCSALTSITIPDSVTSIGNYAFGYCNSLTSITIPGGVTYIADAAFYDCKSLTIISIPDSVTSIGNGAFDNTKYYKNNDNWSNGVLYIGNHLIECNEDYSGEYEIKNGTKCIAGGAFSGCTSLTGITIPDSVKSIGDSAFDNCESLTSITIPDGVTSIGDSAFDNCESLTRITIPDSVTEIGEYAFYDCTSLTSITIPDSVTSIGDGAFYDTEYYKNNDNWSNGVLYIGNHLIKCKEDYSGDYEIKDSTKCIADEAFCCCILLTSITIPNSVTSIGDMVFFGCCSLTSVDVDKNNSNYCSQDGILFNKSMTEIIKYPPKRVETSYVIPASTTEIKTGAFEDSIYLTSVTILGNVTLIDYCAFKDCTSLTSITIPGSVTEIYNDAFLNCDILSDVYYGGTMEQWDDIYFGDNLGNIDLRSATIHFSESQHEHTWSDWTVTTPATVLKAGTETRTCSVCGETETRDIPKIEAPTEPDSMPPTEPDSMPTTEPDSMPSTEPDSMLPTEPDSMPSTEPDSMPSTEPTTELSYMLGDVNEDDTVTAADARLGLRISASLYKPTDNQLLAADADENGIVTASDARKILRVSAQLDSFKETSKVDEGTDDFSKYVGQSSAKVFSDFADAKMDDDGFIEADNIIFMTRYSEKLHTDIVSSVVAIFGDFTGNIFGLKYGMTVNMAQNLLQSKGWGLFVAEDVDTECSYISPDRKEVIILTSSKSDGIIDSISYVLINDIAEDAKFDPLFYLGASTLQDIADEYNKEIIIDDGIKYVALDNIVFYSIQQKDGQDIVTSIKVFASEQVGPIFGIGFDMDPKDIENCIRENGYQFAAMSLADDFEHSIAFHNYYFSDDNNSYELSLAYGEKRYIMYSISTY